MRSILNTLKGAIVICLMVGMTAPELLAQTGGLGTGLKGDEGIPITTAVPFLRIIPDARSGGMGDVGLATTPDANSLFHNPAKMAYIMKTGKDGKDELSDLGLSISYVPWLRSLVNDIYLAHISAYKRIDKLQTIGMSFKYFSLGDITFTNVNGETTGQFRPNEFSLDAAYARILAKGFSAGFALRFIYSNLAAGQTVNGVDIKPGIAAAADISFYYNKDIDVKDFKTNLAFGLNLSNLGSKITYTESAERDFIPMNMGFGANWTFHVDEFNQISIAADMNKLLVPTPDTIDADGNGILDYREKSVPAGLFGSFADAPNGASEEFREMTWSVGIEYWYDQIFAVRAGYFHENQFKGNRKYFTAGLGLRYSVFGLDFSYLIPTTPQRNPLDNTLRFSLLFNFDQLGGGNEATPEPVE